MSDAVRQTTSAGYRFPMARAKSSDYHLSCIPSSDRKPVGGAGGAGGGAGGGAAGGAGVALGKSGHAEKCNVVRSDEIWKESVNQELRGAKDWQNNWGFMTELDARGEKKEVAELPDEVNVYSESVPNTQAGVYGSRLNSEMGQLMQNLQFRFSTGSRKKKLSSEMVCY